MLKEQSYAKNSDSVFSYQLSIQNMEYKSSYHKLCTYESQKFEKSYKQF